MLGRYQNRETSLMSNMNVNNETLLEVDDLVMHFPIYRGVIQRQVGAVRAVDGVSFDIKRGETLGLVGAFRRRRSRPVEGRGTPPNAPQDADDLPGSLRQPESSYDCGRYCG